MKLTFKANLLLFMSLIVFIGCSSESKSLSFDPRSLDFSSVNLGEYSEMTVILTNKMGKDTTLTNIDLSGSSDFSFVVAIRFQS